MRCTKPSFLQAFGHKIFAVSAILLTRSFPFCRLWRICAEHIRCMFFLFHDLMPGGMEWGNPKLYPYKIACSPGQETSLSNLETVTSVTAFRIMIESFESWNPGGDAWLNGLVEMVRWLHSALRVPSHSWWMVNFKNLVPLHLRWYGMENAVTCIRNCTVELDQYSWISTTQFLMSYGIPFWFPQPYSRYSTVHEMV